MQHRNRVERHYAEFYDLYVADFKSDVPIYLDLVAKRGGPVLVAGCRTGRVAGHLARAGWDVRALDTARDQLDVARARLSDCRDRLRVTFHDLRETPLFDGFPVAIANLHAINTLIDVEEQRLYLRHLRRSVGSPGVVALDCFVPLGLVHPELNGEWRSIERQSRGRELKLRDKRELLTPLLEKRTQVFQIDDGPEHTIESHRRYLPPFQLQGLLEEAGFDSSCWIQGYDSSTLGPIEADARPTAPFIVVAEAGS